MTDQKAIGAFLVISAVIANVAVALSVTYLPYADAFNHVARYVMMHDALSGAPTGQPAEVHLLPTAYIAVDLLGAALVHFFSPEATMRILAVLCLIALPAGAYMFVGAVAPAQRVLSVAAALLSFNWYFFYGFVNYILGVALALMLLSWWWPRRGRMSIVECALLSVGCAGLYLVHMAAAAIALLAIGVDCVATVLASFRAVPPGLRHGLFSPRLVHLVVPTLAVALVWLAGKGASSGSDPTGPVFRDVADKALHLATPFYSFGALQAALIAGGYGAALALYLWAVRGSFGLNTQSLLPAFLMMAYVLCPAGIFASFDVDVLFLLPAYLVAFVIPIDNARNAWILRIAVVLWVALLAHAANTFMVAHDIDARLHDFRHVLREVPRGSAVLPLVADHGRYGRVDPYRHFGLIVVADREGRAPGLFAGEQYPIFAHFRVQENLYSPGEPWGTRDFKPLDWSRLRSDYRWIVQAGDDERVTKMVLEHAEEVSRRGDVVLYRVNDRQ